VSAHEVLMSRGIHVLTSFVRPSFGVDRHYDVGVVGFPSLDVQVSVLMRAVVNEHVGPMPSHRLDLPNFVVDIRWNIAILLLRTLEVKLSYRT
jgi:hypothetical protein